MDNIFYKIGLYASLKGNPVVNLILNGQYLLQHCFLLLCLVLGSRKPYSKWTISSTGVYTVYTDQSVDVVNLILNGQYLLPYYI